MIWVYILETTKSKISTFFKFQKSQMATESSENFAIFVLKVWIILEEFEATISIKYAILVFFLVIYVFNV